MQDGFMEHYLARCVVLKILRHKKKKVLQRDDNKDTEEVLQRTRDGTVQYFPKRLLTCLFYSHHQQSPRYLPPNLNIHHRYETAYVTFSAITLRTEPSSTQ